MFSVIILNCILVLVSSYSVSRTSGYVIYNANAVTQNKINTYFNSFPTSIYTTKKPEDLEETTQKYGLEVGLFKSIFSKDEQKIKPQELLAKYGAAYLITSISFAIVSYAICFVLVSNGIDVSSLLEKVGIKATSAASNAGTAGIAYAIHKAASPIRFPPTVALTPVVAGWLGKKVDSNKAEAENK
eukprot:gene8229-11137_t